MSNICKTCNRPTTIRPKRVSQEQFVYIDSQGVNVVEVSDETEDQRNEILEILKSLAESGNVPSATSTIEEIKKYKGIIGNESNKVFDVGNSGFEAVLESVSDLLGSDSGILPRDTVYHSKQRSKKDSNSVNHLLIVTKEPGLIDFTYDEERTVRSKPKTFKLSVPFINFCCIVQENTKNNNFSLFTKYCHIFLTKKQITNEEVPIFRFPTHNQSVTNGALCLGSLRTNLDIKNLPDYVNMCFALILDTKWNTDMSSTYNNVPDELGGNYKEWESRSLLDNFIGMSEKIQWQPHGQSVGTVSQLISQQKSTMSSL